MPEHDGSKDVKADGDDGKDGGKEPGEQQADNKEEDKKADQKPDSKSVDAGGETAKDCNISGKADGIGAVEDHKPDKDDKFLTDFPFTQALVR